MKFMAVLCLVFGLVGAALALKDPRCDLPVTALYNNECLFAVPTYSYNSYRDSCERITAGCPGNGNSFETEGECLVKCWSRSSTSGHNYNNYY